MYFFEFVINCNELFIFIFFLLNYNILVFDEGWCKYFKVYNKILGLINNMMNGGFLFYKVKVKKIKKMKFNIWICFCLY